MRGSFDGLRMRESRERAILPIVGARLLIQRVSVSPYFPSTERA